MILLDEAADRRDFGHARDGIELIANEPVLQAAQVAQRQRGTLERVPEDVSNARGVRAKCRRDAGWQRLGDEAHALEDAGAREVQVDVVVEDDVDHRKAEGRL